MQAIASVVSLDRDVTDVYDIVYSACGTARNDEFLLSLKSLQLMALSSPESEHSLYRIHIITGELHMTCSTLYGPYARHYSLQYRFQWLVYPRHLAKLMHAMQTGVKKDDLQILEKTSSFLFVLHSPSSMAAPLFAPCSTQRLYLHEHPDFDGIDDVSHLYDLPLSCDSAHDDAVVIGRDSSSLCK